MAWQYIIIGLIVAAAATIAIIRMIRFFTNPLRKCDGCGMSCNGCALEELKKKSEVRGQKSEST